MSGFSLSATMSTTAAGNSTLAGKAARNWAKGWTRSVHAGLSPIHTPIGTQITLAMAISTSTRSKVSTPRPATARASLSARVWLRTAMARMATRAVMATTPASQSRSSQRATAGEGGGAGMFSRGSGMAAMARPA